MMSHRKLHLPPLVRWLAVVAWMGLIFFLSAQSSFPHPDNAWIDELISSAAHMGLYGVLAMLVAWASGRHPRSYVLAFSLAAIYALSDEYHQSFVPGRHPDPWDLLCDATGALLGLSLWSLRQRLVARPRRSRAPDQP
jgi:VanZ family protein